MRSRLSCWFGGGLDARQAERACLTCLPFAASALPPSLDFWGYDQWDKDFDWTPKEEREVCTARLRCCFCFEEMVRLTSVLPAAPACQVVRIADIWLMSMVCIMFLVRSHTLLIKMPTN